MVKKEVIFLIMLLILPSVKAIYDDCAIYGNCEAEKEVLNETNYFINQTGGGGGNPFDQSLNTTDNVTFNRINLDAPNGVVNLTFQSDSGAGTLQWLQALDSFWFLDVVSVIAPYFLSTGNVEATLNFIGHQDLSIAGNSEINGTLNANNVTSDNDVCINSGKCLSLSADNSSGILQNYNATGLIQNYNATGLILNYEYLNDSGYIQDWNATGKILNWSDGLDGIYRKESNHSFPGDLNVTGGLGVFGSVLFKGFLTANQGFASKTLFVGNATTGNYASISQGGILTFAGGGQMRIGNDKYAFASALIPSAGIRFDITNGIGFGAYNSAGYLIHKAYLGIAGNDGTQWSRFGFSTTALNVSVSSHQNNWIGLRNTGYGRINASSPVYITGVERPGHGRDQMIKIFNTGSSPVVLSNEDTNSSASNRFRFTNGNLTYINLTTDEGAEMIYDTVSERWRVWSL